ncbi:hypothetical protein OGAPHI_003172 [Ogataea philodendri]|uniref:Maltose/galactoside acetyltransferase domain-containing protein n=1 Tax=Ogataea philodendri TaxID=1378263 RepID=A0A9P8P852_9ASCO|nr:uncharacterized protein OGAPHI_003172 [Ogataea philodendri]KAH3667523.1 hypothetical protein OGAPHI_003172 [Ogataea philodendri]
MRSQSSIMVQPSSDLDLELIKFAHATIENVPDTPEYDKMISGMVYDSFSVPLETARFRSTMICSQLQRMSLDHYSNLDDFKIARTRLTRQILGKCGKNPLIETPFSCDYGLNIVAGDDLYINANAVLLDTSLIILGNNCKIGPNVTITTADHPLDANGRSEGLDYSRKVIIGDNCWIAANATILPGVQLGDNVVVGAGSVVTKNIESNSLVLGVPGRIVRKLNQKITDE